MHAWPLAVRGLRPLALTGGALVVAASLFVTARQRRDAARVAVAD